jgi:hypothetical protein
LHPSSSWSSQLSSLLVVAFRYCHHRLLSLIPRFLVLHTSSAALATRAGLLLFPSSVSTPSEDSCAYSTMQSKHAAVPLLQLSTFPVTVSVCCLSSPFLDPCLQRLPRVWGCSYSHSCPRFPDSSVLGPRSSVSFPSRFQHSEGSCAYSTMQSKHAATPLLQLPTFPVTASVCCPHSSFLVPWSRSSVSVSFLGLVPHSRSLSSCLLGPGSSVSFPVSF